MTKKGGDELITLATASEIANRDTSTLRRMISRKKLKATKLGRDWLVTREALEEYMASPGYSDKKSEGRRRKG